MKQSKCSLIHFKTETRHNWFKKVRRGVTNLFQHQSYLVAVAYKLYCSQDESLNWSLPNKYRQQMSPINRSLNKSHPGSTEETFMLRGMKNLESLTRRYFHRHVNRYLYPSANIQQQANLTLVAHRQLTREEERATRSNDSMIEAGPVLGRQTCQVWGVRSLGCRYQLKTCSSWKYR